jgi:hypothetical protein
MKLHPVLILFFGILALLVPSPLSGQAVPVGPLIELCAADPGYPGDTACYDPAASILGPTGFALASEQEFRSQDYSGWTSSCKADVLDAAGRLTGAIGLDQGRDVYDYIPWAPAVAGNAAGRSIAAWSVVLYARADVRVQRFGPGATGDAESIGTPDEGFCQWSPAVAINAAGQSAVAWEESPGCHVEHTWIALKGFGTAGKPATPLVTLYPPSNTLTYTAPQVKIDQDGRMTVLWRMEESTGTHRATIIGQRFGRDGRLLGPGFTIGPPGSRGGLLALEPGGSFVAAWSEPTATGAHLVLQWRTPAGAPALPKREVSAAPDAVPQALAIDRHGNLALLWEESETLRFRLFNRALVPQGDSIEIGRSRPTLTQRISGSLALTDAGRLLVAWTGPRKTVAENVRLEPLVAQVWQARHNADPCLRRGNLFLCDTAGNGGEPEESFAFGAPADIPLLGDWDGDGQADPCVYRAGRFLCRGGSQTARLGLPGDRPLLADLNGDGRADACLRRGKSFLCDVDRNGTLETRIDFGQPNDVPLLADINGDRKADPCVERAGLYLCDTAHNGGAAEVVLNLNPALAGVGSGTPLLGDVDGNSRADACLWSAGRLICGFFARTGGAPQSVLDLPFGQPGDVPLLGDVDAF